MDAMAPDDNGHSGIGVGVGNQVRQRFPRELVDHVEQLEYAAIRSDAERVFEGPDVVGGRWRRGGRPEVVELPSRWRSRRF